MTTVIYNHKENVIGFDSRVTDGNGVVLSDDIVKMTKTGIFWCRNVAVRMFESRRHPFQNFPAIPLLNFIKIKHHIFRLFSRKFQKSRFFLSTKIDNFLNIFHNSINNFDKFWLINAMLYCLFLSTRPVPHFDETMDYQEFEHAKGIPIVK